MKIKDIVIGGRYHDSKVGVREIVDIRNGTRVTYRILSAKATQEYSYADKKVVSTIGTTSSCDLTSFAQWAKIKLGESEYTQLLIELTTKKLRLPPGEKAFMESVAEEFNDGEFPASIGTTVSFSFNETRLARGIEKKGLAVVSMAQTRGAGGEIKLTALGASWIRSHNTVVVV